MYINNNGLSKTVKVYGNFLTIYPGTRKYTDSKVLNKIVKSHQDLSIVDKKPEPKPEYKPEPKSEHIIEKKSEIDTSEKKSRKKKKKDKSEDLNGE